MNSFTFAFHHTRRLFSLLAGLALTFAHGDRTHRTAHDFAVPVSEVTQLADQVQLIRPAWEYAIHTGAGKSGSGPAIGILEQGFEPTFGDTASTIVADGVYLVSWSEAILFFPVRNRCITDPGFTSDVSHTTTAAIECLTCD